MEVNSVNPNITGLNNAQSGSIERVSTGSKINQVSDDASKLILSDALNAKRSELSQSLQNINEGLALTKIASDALTQQQDILETIREKLVQANSDTNSAEDKEQLKQEMVKLAQSVQFIAQSTTFSGENLIDGPSENTLDVSTSDSTFSIEVPLTGQIANELATLIGATNFQSGDIESILSRVDLARDEISKASSDFGAVQVELQATARNTISQELTAAKANSSLTDVDFGKEITDFSKSNILTQIGYLVSTQANASSDHNVKLLV